MASKNSQRRTRTRSKRSGKIKNSGHYCAEVLEIGGMSLNSIRRMTPQAPTVRVVFPCSRTISRMPGDSAVMRGRPLIHVRRAGSRGAADSGGTTNSLANELMRDLGAMRSFASRTYHTVDILSTHTPDTGLAKRDVF